MERPYYRLRIEELNSGDKRYIVEEGQLHIGGKWIQRQEIRWKAIGPSGITEAYDNEQDAIDFIKSLEEHWGKYEGKPAKKTTYKYF